jgi:protein Mpv17
MCDKLDVEFGLQGGALVAPVLGIWYGILNGMIPGTGVVAAVGKTVLDQAVFAPCFVALFISTLLLLDGTPKLIKSKLEQDLVPTVVANWSLWIPGQLINFYFVPPQLTLLCSNFIALIWCTYLSWAANRKVEKPLV